MLFLKKSVKNKQMRKSKAPEFIELSDDDEHNLNHAPRKQAFENSECSIWYMV